MPIFNVKTGEQEQLEGDALRNALAQGTHAYAKGERVNIRGPNDEQLNIPAENVVMAMDKGYRPVSASEQAIEEYVQENKGLKGALKVGIGQFVDEAAMGLPELIASYKQDPFEVAKREALKKEHELTNTIGGVLGAGTSLLYGGPLFKAGTKAGEVGAKATGILAEKILQTSAEEVAKRTATTAAKEILKKSVTKAGGMAAEGMTLAAPHAITETMLGDPEAAAESLLFGAGLGAVFGGGGSMLKELTGPVAKKVAQASGINRILEGGDGMRTLFKEKAEEKAVEALNATLSQTERLSRSKDVKQLGRFLLDEGVVTPLASKKDIFQRLDDKTMEYGKQIGEKLQKFDEQILASQNANLLIDSKEVANKIMSGVKQKYGHLDAYQGVIENLERQIAPMRASNATWTIGEANAQKAAWGDVIKTWGLDKTAEKKLAENIYRGINDEIENKIEIGFGKEALQEFKDLKTKYGYLEEAEKIAEKSMAREAKNNDVGLTSYISGGVGGLIGGGPGVVIGLLGREGMRRYGDQILASAYDKMGGLLFAEKAMKNVADKLDIIPEAMKEMAKKVLPKAESTSLYALNRLLSDNESTKKSSVEDRAQQIEELNKKASVWAANPDAFMEKVNEITRPIAEGGAPQIALSTQVKYSQALGYLFSQMPKPPRPKSPFSYQYKWKPSDFEISAYEQKVQTVLDPFSVFGELKKGTLTKNHIQALKAVYPRIYSTMKDRMQNQIMKDPMTVPYNNRAKLSLIMEAPMDVSFEPQKMLGYQETWLNQEDMIDENSAAEVNVAGEMASDVEKLMG